MYNFLDPKLLPKVSSDLAALENYEVSNLINENFLIKSRGFIAFTTAKPPVDIDFELLCPVSLFYISLSTVVGTQKSTGIEVFTRNSSSSPYISICQAFFREPGVIFCNSRWYSKDARPENSNREFHLAFFKSNTFRAFTSTSSVKVRILQTERSVPCIATVEVWGRCAKSCSDVTVRTVNKLLNVQNSPENNHNSANLRGSKCVDDTTTFEIPEDFKDELTFELMAMPVTLPSGHTVDQSTLEKCVSNNASYGRQGSDPFTGLIFTDVRKPVLNVSLKARIDMFLMQNLYRPETFNLKRTLGRLPEGKSKSTNCSEEDLLKKKRIKFKETDVSDSLDDAISKVLSNDKFLIFTKDYKEVGDLKKKCNRCSSDDDLYELPCKHLSCRKCLLELKAELECKECSCKFKKNDLLKFHS